MSASSLNAPVGTAGIWSAAAHALRAAAAALAEAAVGRAVLELEGEEAQRERLEARVVATPAPARASRRAPPRRAPRAPDPRGCARQHSTPRRASSAASSSARLDRERRRDARARGRRRPTAARSRRARARARTRALRLLGRAHSIASSRPRPRTLGDAGGAPRAARAARRAPRAPSARRARHQLLLLEHARGSRAPPRRRADVRGRSGCGSPRRPDGGQASITSARPMQAEIGMPDARPFADAQQIRHDALVLAGEPASGATEAGVDLVDDQQPALASQSARSPRRKPGRRNALAAAALDRLDQHARRSAARLRARGAQRVVGVAVAREDGRAAAAAPGTARGRTDARWRRARRGRGRGRRPRRRRRRRVRSRAARSSARPRPRPSPSCRGSRARVRRRESGCASASSSSTLTAAGCTSPIACSRRCGLLRDRGDDARVRVADGRDAEPGSEVDVAVAVDVPDVRAARALPEDGRRRQHAGHVAALDPREPRARARASAGPGTLAAQRRQLLARRPTRRGSVEPSAARTPPRRPAVPSRRRVARVAYVGLGSNLGAREQLSARRARRAARDAGLRRRRGVVALRDARRSGPVRRART